MQTHTKNLPVEEMKNIVGEGNVREASAEDAVEGVEPHFVVEPATVEETSELMKLAAEEGLVVAPRGGGTKTHLGDPPHQLDLIVSTARMSEIIEHVPGDQVVRVQAGTKLDDLQENLSGSDQMIAIYRRRRGPPSGASSRRTPRGRAGTNTGRSGT